jgi:hypothetical protein
VDPIHPIAPGPPTIAMRPPVRAVTRVSRDQDRPSQDSEPRRRREQPAPEPEGSERSDDDDGRLHVDVRV